MGKVLDDTLGLSKEVPDERVVRTHQTLAVPPDLQLRPPAPGETVTGTLNPAARQAANQRTYATPPGGVGSQVVPPQGAQAAVQQPQPYTQTPAAAQPAPYGTAQPPAQPVGDIYERNGISKTHPDGKEKTNTELAKELRAVSLQKKRAKNPKYGTIWNFPNLFSDD